MEDKESSKETQRTKSPKILWAILIGLIIVAILSGAVMATRVWERNSQFRSGKNWVMKGRGMSQNRGMAKGRYNLDRRTGDITKIEGNNFAFKDSNDNEINATILDSTSIYNKQNIASITDLKVGAKVMVAGRPNSNGVVVSKEIIIQ